MTTVHSSQHPSGTATGARRPSLPEAPDLVGRDPIGSVRLRSPVRVAGEVVKAGVHPWAGGDVFECVLDDGTGTIVLAFLGRRSVPGIRVGALLSADGTVGTHRGRVLILNPLVTFLALEV
jgi:RecJ-like exonuclease